MPSKARFRLSSRHKCRCRALRCYRFTKTDIFSKQTFEKTCTFCTRRYDPVLQLRVVIERDFKPCIQ